MKKMQRPLLKILTLSLLLLTCTLHPLFAQISSHRLKTADSLFVAKRYTQSFEHYQEILSQSQYTPAMLLKMAYIQEGLENIGQALYYLNLYYAITRDVAAIGKMEELAKKYNLEGYENTDTTRLLTFYRDYHFNITLALAAIVVLLFSIVFYTKVRLKRRPLASAIVLLLAIVGFFVHRYIGAEPAAGIVAQANTYIMDGPSAAASVLEIVKGGHRVEITGQKDVWLQIKWGNNIAYVRNNALLPVKL